LFCHEKFCGANSRELLNVSLGKATLGPDIDTLPRELKMNERHVLCAVGAQSGFMYVGREVFDEIVASAAATLSMIVCANV